MRVSKLFGPVAASILSLHSLPAFAEETSPPPETKWCTSFAAIPSPDGKVEAAVAIVFPKKFNPLRKEDTIYVFFPEGSIVFYGKQVVPFGEVSDDIVKGISNNIGSLIDICIEPHSPPVHPTPPPNKGKDAKLLPGGIF